jgi:succinylglutamic semialdehyde dehydrogenase
MEHAIESAQTAFQSWKITSLELRLRQLKQFEHILGNHRDELAQIISSETGKVLWECRQEVSALLGKLSHSMDAYLERCPQRVSQTDNAVFVTRHKPHGVVAVFGPFNFPAHLPFGHIIPALLAGNTIIFKPSPKTPKVAECLMSLLDSSGFPIGVVNLIHGDTSIAKKLANHSGIRALFFTGSSDVGLGLMKTFAKTPGRMLALEMGGNNPLVVSHVHDVKQAITRIIQSAFITTGQRCTCARRLIILDTPRNRDLVTALVNTVRGLATTHTHDHENAFMGSLISRDAVDAALAFQSHLLKEGASAYLEAESLSKRSAHMSPGILDVTHSHIPDRECFGPILLIKWVTSFSDAITRANNTEYGLSAALLSDSEADYTLFQNEIRAGIINWNTATTGASGAQPFGGIGLSGNFRPSAYYAADYCSYPVASTELRAVSDQDASFPGIPDISI